MYRIIYFFFIREVVAGDDGKITIREVATAWFVLFSVALTGFGAYLAIFEKLSRDYIEMLIACYAMTVTLLGISTGKSSFNRFVQARYENKTPNNSPDNSPGI